MKVIESREQVDPPKTKVSGGRDAARWLGLFLSMGCLAEARADLLLWQDFNSATTAGSLVDTSSSDTSRFYAISTIPADADNLPAAPGGNTEEQRLDGIGTTAINAGKLAFSLLGSWQTYYPTGQSTTLRLRDSRVSTGELVRVFPSGSRPTLFYWRFKLKATATNLATVDEFLQGAAFARVFAGKTLFTLYAGGGSRLVYRPPSGPDQIFNEEVEITVVINKTGGSLNYLSPSGNQTSIGAATYDAWIDDTLIADEGEYLAGTEISNVKVIFNGTINAGIEDLGGNVFQVPYSPGPAFQFEIDDVLMRSDLEQTVPTGAPSLSLSGNLQFGKKPKGSRSRKTMIIQNGGTAAMNVTQVAYPSPVFTGAFSGPIPAGQSRVVSVTFAPKRAKTYRGSVLVLSDAPNSPRTLPISGTGR